MRSNSFLFVGLLAAAIAAGCGDAPPRAAPTTDPSVAQRAALVRRLERLAPGRERTAAEMELAVVGLQGTTGRADWNVRLADAVTALHELLDAKRAAGDAAAEAQVRVAFGTHLSMTGDHAAADVQFDWVLEHAPASRDAPAALTEKASNRWRQGDIAASKALLERVLLEFPDSPEAATAPLGIRNCERKLAE